MVEVLTYDAYQVRIHGSRHVSKHNRSHLQKIAPFTPEVKLYPAASLEAQMAPQKDVTAIADRFIAVQPPNSWDWLSPLPHWQQPAGWPGDEVTKLRRAEKERK